ncbi:hypothetical protein [Gordonia terrae]
MKFLLFVGLSTPRRYDSRMSSPPAVIPEHRARNNRSSWWRWAGTLSVVAILTGCSGAVADAPLTSPPVAESAETSGSVPTSSPARSAVASVEVPSDQGEYTITAGTISQHCDGEAFYNGQTPPAPRVFDTNAGTFKVASLPSVPAGEELRTSQCVVTRHEGEIRVAYAIETQTPASGLTPLKNHKRAYVFTLDATNPAATADLPLRAELRGGSSLGVPLVVRDDKGDAHTEFLSPSDLSTRWTHPGELSYASTPDALAIYSAKDASSVDIVDARTGKIIVGDPGQDQNSREVLAFTDGFYVGHRMVRTPDGKTLYKPADTGWTGVDYQLSQSFFLIASNDLLQVFDVNTGKPVIDLRDEAAEALGSHSVRLFGERLFLHSTSSAGVETKKVIGLPSQEELADSWSEIPYADLDGWTLTTSNCMSVELVIEHCDGMKLVKDVDGQYPPLAER